MREFPPAYLRFTIPVCATVASATVPKPTTLSTQRDTITSQANAPPSVASIGQPESTLRSPVDTKRSAAKANK